MVFRKREQRWPSFSDFLFRSRFHSAWSPASKPKILVDLTTSGAYGYGSIKEFIPPTCRVSSLRSTKLSHNAIFNLKSVADLRVGRAGSDPPWATDWRRHSRYSWYVTTVLYYGDTIDSLSLQTRKTWCSDYSELLPPVAGSYLQCKFVFGRGPAPDPAGGAYSAPPEPIAGLRGLLLSGRKTREGEKERGREGNNMGTASLPPSQILGSAPANSSLVATRLL